MAADPIQERVSPVWLMRSAPNLITAVRVVVLFAVAVLAVQDNATASLIAVPLCLAALAMDWLDGAAARRWGGATRLGGVVDILGDRLAENVWWVTLAWLHLVPLWVPVVVMSRGFLTDAARGYALSRGLTAFGSSTMLRSSLGRALVASRWSRAIYGLTKVIAFVLLFTLNACVKAAISWSGMTYVAAAADLAVLLTVALCLIRGVPVITALMGMVRIEGNRR